MANNLVASNAQPQWRDKNFEEKLSPAIDEIYKKYFKVDEVIRSDRTNYVTDLKSKILDENLGIDSIIHLSDGGFITAQEKILRYSKKDYKELTIEYKNNRIGSVYGDWFHLASQLYMFAYALPNEIDLYKYWVLDVIKLRLYLQTLDVSQYIRPNKLPNRSNFLAIPFELIEKRPNIVLFSQ